MSTTDALIDRVRAFAGARVLVVGDVMLDEYLEGGVGRISPEAPVPVVQVNHRFATLGGAANVARSIAELGGTPTLCGVVGSDAFADELEQLCDASGVTAALSRHPTRPTTRKLRVLGHGQQLIRLDWEDTSPVDEARIAAALDTIVDDKPDAILISDYAKGFVSRQAVARLVAAGRDASIPVLIDPKQPDPTWYRGATVLKPNVLELESMVERSLRGKPDAELAAAAVEVLERAEASTMVLTLGARGMLVVERSGAHTTVAAAQRDVFDVTGAGDTVLAVLALALARGSALSEAAHIANIAAGIVVGEIGTAAVSPNRLIDGLHPHAATKRVSRGAIGERVRSWQRAGKKVVFTNGCFDLLHAGHLYMLQKCAGLGDVLVVGINTDASVQRLKGPTRPLVPQHERASLVGALDCVDAVVLFDEDTPLALLEQVRPNVLAKGNDYRIDQVVGRELVESLGGHVALVPLLPDHSTTELVRRIQTQRRNGDPL